MLVTDQLVDHVGKCDKAIVEMTDAKGKPAKIHGLWALGLDSLDDKTLALLARDKDRTVRVHNACAGGSRSMDGSQAELMQGGEPIRPCNGGWRHGATSMMANVSPIASARNRPGMTKSWSIPHAWPYAIIFLQRKRLKRSLQA